MTTILHDESLSRGMAEVGRRLRVVEELERVVRGVSNELQRATRLRRSILQKALSGQFVPPTNARSTNGDPAKPSVSFGPPS